MTFQIMYPNRPSQATQTTVISAPYPRSTVALSRAATSRPASVRRLGPIRMAGCRRVCMTCCSLGRRYLLTAAGPLAARLVTLIGIGSERVHECGQRGSGIVHAVIGVVDEAPGSRRLGGDIENDEEHDRPCDDLLHHLITSQRLSLQATCGGPCRPYSPA